MVREMGSGPGRKAETDWLAVFLEYETGTTAGEIAKRLGCHETTVRHKAGQYNQVLKRLAINLPERLDLHLRVAEQLIAGGQMADAEKASKAIFAVIRAARSLEQWRGDMNKDTSRSASDDDEEDITLEELRAELEQKIARIAGLDGGDAKISRPDESGNPVPPETKLGHSGPG